MPNGFFAQNLQKRSPKQKGVHHHKIYFGPNTEKVNSTIKFCLFKLVLVPNFSLKWQFWFFGPSLTPKGNFWILYILIILGTKFQLNSIFLDQICPKQLFLVKSQKNEHHQRILNFWISLGSMFQFKLTNSDFLDQI